MPFYIKLNQRINTVIKYLWKNSKFIFDSVQCAQQDQALGKCSSFDLILITFFYAT